MKQAKGFILYKGPSVLDGAPIVAIATLGSKNRKTGDMVQTWILRGDSDPVAISKAGADSSICGNCPHKHSVGGACYVNIGQAPLSIWRAYHRGAYADYSPELARGRAIRLGAYGDPAAVPFEVWRDLLADTGAKVWTGYTHQSRHKKFDARLLQLCMASADTEKQAQALQAIGARTFRVKHAAADFLDGEVECLADSQGLACIECGLCDGAKTAKRFSVAINVHGSRASRFGNNIIVRVAA